MENFTYDIATKIYFGKGQITNLPIIMSTYGKKVLLVYGGSSIKKIGLYDELKELLIVHSYHVYELAGVEPNPRIETVEKGINLCRINDVDIILAVGGGSAIDCAKLIAAGACYEKDPWDLVLHPKKIEKALPVFTILTIAATGSEMDHIAVISNAKTKEKIGTRNPLLRPKASILDPTYTYSVNSFQSACGVVDIMSHALESYFAKEDAYLQNTFAEGILRTCIKYGNKVITHPNDYEARSNIMWASSWAINDVLKLGHMTPWSVHPIEHQLSAYYDITHGLGLAILTPAWMRYIVNEKTVEKFVELASHVWSLPLQEDRYQTAHSVIDRFEAFFKGLGLQDNLTSLGIDETHIDEMAQKAARSMQNSYVPLQIKEIVEIYRNCL